MGGYSEMCEEQDHQEIRELKHRLVELEEKNECLVDIVNYYKTGRQQSQDRMSELETAVREFLAKWDDSCVDPEFALEIIGSIEALRAALEGGDAK